VYDELYFRYCQRIVNVKGESWDMLRRFPSADVLVNQACDWLGSLNRKPFFLWLHLMDPHAPYYPAMQALPGMGDKHVDPERGRYLNAAWSRADLGTKRLRRYRNDVVRLYDAGIRWVDTQLAGLVEALRKESLWDSCLFVLTADHGEEFLDHGGRFHPPSRAYQELLHVPLLVRVPGMQKTQLSDAPFSHVHLAPTLLDALGIDPPSEFQGRSYWAEAERGGDWEWAVSESIGQCANPMDAGMRLHGSVLAVQDQRYKLVLDFDRKREELFDLDNDPWELGALAAEAEESVRARLLGIVLQQLENDSSRTNRELAIRARLREVGLEWKHSKMSPEPLAS